MGLSHILNLIERVLFPPHAGQVVQSFPFEARSTLLDSAMEFYETFRDERPSPAAAALAALLILAMEFSVDLKDNLPYGVDLESAMQVGQTATTLSIREEAIEEVIQFYLDSCSVYAAAFPTQNPAAGDAKDEDLNQRQTGVSSSSADPIVPSGLPRIVKKGFAMQGSPQ